MRTIIDPAGRLAIPKRIRGHLGLRGNGNGHWRSRSVMLALHGCHSDPRKGGRRGYIKDLSAISNTYVILVVVVNKMPGRPADHGMG
jgi:hypothetical protein